MFSRQEYIPNGNIKDKRNISDINTWIEEGYGTNILYLECSKTSKEEMANEEEEGIVILERDKVLKEV